MRAAAIVAIALTCLGAITSRAQIGRTPEQCVTSYGREFGEKTQEIGIYRQGEISVLVSFAKGHAVLVIYNKERGTISDLERDGILAQNRRGDDWERLGYVGNGILFFQTKDEKFKAFIEPSKVSIKSMF